MHLGVSVVPAWYILFSVLACQYSSKDIRTSIRMLIFNDAIVCAVMVSACFVHIICLHLTINVIVVQ